MNILYTITWPAGQSDELPRQFYDQLREGVARGAQFPFDCPYEVALVHATQTPDATPPAYDWAVAVLAMRVTTHEIGAADLTMPALESWFRDCIPGGVPPGSKIESAEASHLKLASELRSDYDVVASFGTFVGEPELEVPPPVITPPPPLSFEAEALKAVLVPPVTPEVPKTPLVPPVLISPPPPAVTPARTDDSSTLSTCLGIALLGGGVLLIPVSVLLGALFAFGQFSTDPTTGGASHTSTTDFLLLVACCPLPLLLLGIGMIFLGIYIPRWLKHNQAQPAIPPR